jgi:hypothetical protein
MWKFCDVAGHAMHAVDSYVFSQRYANICGHSVTSFCLHFTFIHCLCSVRNLTFTQLLIGSKLARVSVVVLFFCVNISTLLKRPGDVAFIDVEILKSVFQSHCARLKACDANHSLD